MEEKERHKANDYVFRHESVVESLNEIYAEKCGYCESKLFVTCSLCVDHYRPKKGVKGLSHSGYFWLAYEWSNLVSSCSICNNNKSNLFPIEDEMDRVAAPSEKREQWRADSEHMLGERPLLLHPEIDNAEEYLQMDANGVLTAKNGSLRGRTTIEIFDLNRDGLIRERKKIVQEIKEKLWEKALSIKNDVERGKIGKAEFLEEIRKCDPLLRSLVEKAKPHMEYSFVGKTMASEFKEFFIEPVAKRQCTMCLGEGFQTVPIQFSKGGGRCRMMKLGGTPID